MTYDFSIPYDNRYDNHHAYETRRSPTPDFPLTPHNNGQFCKKIQGRMYYFGTDWQAALRKYHAMLEAGRTRSRRALRGSWNRVTSSRSGEISDRHYKDLDRTLASLSETIGPTKPVAGLRSADYGTRALTLPETNGPVSLGITSPQHLRLPELVQREKIISELPADGLKKPSRKVLRCERAKRKLKDVHPE